MTSENGSTHSSIRWITADLAIGNIETAMDVASLRAAGVGAVLGLNRFPSLQHVPDLVWHRVELLDGPGNAVDEVMRAILQLEQLLERHRVLMHCDAGLSRSPFIAACYLARCLARSFDAAFALVQTKLPEAKTDVGLLAILPSLDLTPPVHDERPGR